MNKKLLVLLAVIVLALAGGGLVFYDSFHKSEQVATSSFSLVDGEKPDWTLLQAPYKDGGDIEKRANEQIAEYQKLTDSGERTKYDMDVDIAQNYELLGEGQKSYNYLMMAINEDPKETLAYGNLGQLLRRAGALKSAKKAFELAIETGPQFNQNQYAYIEFLVRYGNGVASKSEVDNAINKALEQFPDYKPLLSLKSEWEKDNK